MKNSRGNEENINNAKRMWGGMNSLMRNKKNRKSVGSIRRHDDQLSQDPRKYLKRSCTLPLQGLDSHQAFQIATNYSRNIYQKLMPMARLFNF